MGALDLAEVMDDLAAEAPTGWNAYAYPADGIVVPAMVVGYPDEIDIAQTFTRGTDHCIIPVWFVVGRVVEKAARDKLSALLSGSVDIIATLRNAAGQVSEVVKVTVETITVGAVAYLAARFDVEVWS